MDRNNLHSISNEQKRVINQTRVPMDVSPYEAAVLKEIRRIEFGRITIVMFDGIASRIEVGQSFNISPDGKEVDLKGGDST